MQVKTSKEETERLIIQGMIEKLVSKDKQMTTLEENTGQFLKDGIKSVSHQEQMFFMHTSMPLEAGLRGMIESLELYCKGFCENQESDSIECYYTAPYLSDIARNLQGLLSSLGKFDGGILSKTLHEICEKYDLEME